MFDKRISICIVLYIMLTCISNCLCTFTFSLREVNVQVKHFATLDFVVRAPVEQTNITIEFRVNYSNIASLGPKYIVLENNITNESLPILIHGLQPGKSDVCAEFSPSHSSINEAFMKVNVYKSDMIIAISNIIGWIYFCAWSFSFYPQIWMNYERKSVVGLNFDFVSLNIIGFTSYSVFNIGLYAIPLIKKQYEARYPRSVIPVLPNDILFAVHGAVATIFTGIQCLIYERRSQRISNYGRFCHIVFAILLLFSSSFAWMNTIEWLDFMYICSYIKLFVTVTKYVPQAYMNYSRKSTVGWNIYNVIGDLIGGIFSIIQMFLNAYNYDEWEGIIENPTKFWLGVLSIVFDLIFMIQHYILYKEDISDIQETENMLDEEKSSIGKDT